jgi:tetratricopeptide (TPR) repeat protein
MEVFDKKIRLAWATNDTAMAIWYQIRKANHMIYGWNDVDSVWKEAAKTIRFQESHGSPDYWYSWAELNVYSGKYFEADETAKGLGRAQQQVFQSLIHGAKGECSKAKSFADMRLRETPGFRKALLLYRVAECQYEKGQWQEAIEASLEVQDVYTYVPLSDGLAVFYPKSFYLLGKVYEEKGDKQKAIENTEKFLDLWKDADPDLPDLIDAKERLARLKGMTQKNNL